MKMRQTWMERRGKRGNVRNERNKKENRSQRNSGCGDEKKKKEVHREGERNGASVTDCAPRMLSFLFFYLLTLLFPLPLPHTHTAAAALAFISHSLPSTSFTTLLLSCVGGQLC